MHSKQSLYSLDYVGISIQLQYILYSTYFVLVSNGHQLDSKTLDDLDSNLSEEREMDILYHELVRTIPKHYLDIESVRISMIILRMWANFLLNQFLWSLAMWTFLKIHTHTPTPSPPHRLHLWSQQSRSQSTCPVCWHPVPSLIDHPAGQLIQTSTLTSTTLLGETRQRKTNGRRGDLVQCARPSPYIEKKTQSKDMCMHFLF